MLVIWQEEMGRLGLTTNTSGALYVGSHGAAAYEGTHADGECIHAISNAGTFKVKSHGVAQTSEFGHGIKGSEEGLVSLVDKSRNHNLPGGIY